MQHGCVSSLSGAPPSSPVRGLDLSDHHSPTGMRWHDSTGMAPSRKHGRFPSLAETPAPPLADAVQPTVLRCNPPPSITRRSPRRRRWDRGPELRWLQSLTRRDNDRAAFIALYRAPERRPRIHISPSSFLASSQLARATTSFRVSLMCLGASSLEEGGRPRPLGTPLYPPCRCQVFHVCVCDGTEEHERENGLCVTLLLGGFLLPFLPPYTSMRKIQDRWESRENARLAVAVMVFDNGILP